MHQQLVEFRLVRRKGSELRVVDHHAALFLHFVRQLCVHIVGIGLVGGQVQHGAHGDLPGLQLPQEFVDPHVVREKEGEVHLAAQFPHLVCEKVVV